MVLDQGYVCCQLLPQVLKLIRHDGGDALVLARNHACSDGRHTDADAYGHLWSNSSMAMGGSARVRGRSIAGECWW